MKQRNIIIIIVLGLLILSVVSMKAGLFSIIDSGGELPSCEVPHEGGECELILQLNQGEKLGAGYSFDIATETTHDDDFKDEKQVFLSASGGPYKERNYVPPDDYDEEWDTLYVYNTPTEWRNVYEYQVKATANAFAKTSGDGRAYAYIYAGYINVPYPYSQVEVCSFDDDNLCGNEDYYLVQQFLDSKGRETIYLRHETLTAGTDLYVRGNSNTYPDTLKGDITSTTVFSGSSLPEEDARFLVDTKKKIKYYAGSTVTISEPTVMASWKEEYFITDLKVYIGDELLVTYPGKITETVYLPSMTEKINDFCGRTGLFPMDDVCVVRMKMTSSNGGRILIASELGELEPVGGSFDFFSLTGWVTLDYANEPTNAGVTSAFILLIAGVIGYFIVTGGKKK